MPKSKAQIIAQTKYDQKSYDQILIKVKKGKRDEYKAAAEICEVGLMELFRRGVDEYIKNHAGEVITPTPAPVPVGDKLSSEQRKLLATADNLPPDARKQLVKFLESLVTNAPASNVKDGD